MFNFAANSINTQTIDFDIDAGRLGQFFWLAVGHAHQY